MLDVVRDKWPVWRARVVFAAVLLVFSEWVVWQTPLDFTALEWLGWGALYLALAALMLDLFVRFRVGELFGLLLLAGVYGLINATLISHISTQDLPFSLIVRPLAAQPLAFIGAFAAYQVLTSGRATGPLDLAVAAAAGLAWGVWTRWFPVVSAEPLPDVARQDALVALALLLVALLVLASVVPPPVLRRRADWLLTPVEWVPVVAVLAVALVAQASRDAVGPGLVIVVLLAGFMLAVLYLTLPLRHGNTLLDFVMPQHGPNPVAWMLLVVPFLVAGAIGFSLPGEGDGSVQSDILIGLLTGFGIVWPPAVSGVIGVRTFVQLTRRGLW